MIKPTRTLDEWEEYVYQSDLAQEKSLDITAAAYAFIDALTSIKPLEDTETDELKLKEVVDLSAEIVPYLNDLAALLVEDIRDIRSDDGEENSEES